MSLRSTRLLAARRAILVVVMALAALGLLGHQPFAVGDRDLIVVGVDFVEGQEAVAVATVLHERRLQRRFDPHDLG